MVEIEQREFAKKLKQTMLHCLGDCNMHIKKQKMNIYIYIFLSLLTSNINLKIVVTFCDTCGFLFSKVVLRFLQVYITLKTIIVNK